jgi:D-glycero-D-manno-heptose 1,7-bisphosphate phosphatase
MAAELQKAGARLDGVYYCPHVATDNCDCRKPKTGMLERAARELELDLKNSFVVGDRHGDVELSHSAGARSVLVRTGYGEGELAWHAKNWPRKPEFIAADLTEAVQWILQEVRR